MSTGYEQVCQAGMSKETVLLLACSPLVPPGQQGCPLPNHFVPFVLSLMHLGILKIHLEHKEGHVLVHHQ